MADSSYEPVARRFDLGEKATARTGAVCALSRRNGGGIRWAESLVASAAEGSKCIVEVLSSDAVAMYRSSDDMEMSLMPVRNISRGHS